MIDDGLLQIKNLRATARRLYFPLFSCAGFFRTLGFFAFGLLPIRPCRFTIFLSADRFFRPYHIVVHWSILPSTEFPPCQPNHIVVPPIRFLRWLSPLRHLGFKLSRPFPRFDRSLFSCALVRPLC